MTDQEVIAVMARAASAAMLSGRWKVTGNLDALMYGEEMAVALDGLAAAGLCIVPTTPSPAMIAAGEAAACASPAEIFQAMVAVRAD